MADPAQAAALIARSAELRRRLVLPHATPLTLPVLLGHRFALEFLLVELGDETYIRMRAAELYGESEGTIVTWKVMYAHPPPLLVDGVQPGDTHDTRPQKLHATREMVRQLLAAKEAQDLPARARRTLKTRVLTETVLPGVLIAALIFAAALVRYRVIMLDTLGPVLAAAVTGAVLGQFRKLRDEVRRGSQVREFVPLFFGQVLVGVVTGLFVALAASQLSILNLADPRTLPALAFGAGFSEAAFLGLVSKLIGDATTDARDGVDRSSEGKARHGSSDRRTSSSSGSS